jgi:hypothetical protein
VLVVQGPGEDRRKWSIDAQVGVIVKDAHRWAPGHADDPIEIEVAVAGVILGHDVCWTGVYVDPPPPSDVLQKALADTLKRR